MEEDVGIIVKYLILVIECKMKVLGEIRDVERRCLGKMSLFFGYVKYEMFRENLGRVVS